MDKVEKKLKEYPSLFEEFKSGDRVNRIETDVQGNNQKYDGIVMAVKDDRMIVCWDRVNGKYNSTVDMMITTCPSTEIFEGNDTFSPIRKKKYL